MELLRTLAEHALNFIQLIRGVARRCPSSHALVTDEQTFSFLEFWRNIASAGQFYLDYGVIPGRHVLLVLPNGPDFLHFHFGALKIGAISIPVRFEYTGWEVGRIAANCEPEVVISTSDWIERNRALLHLPGCTRILSVEEIRPQLRSGTDWVFSLRSQGIASINYSYFGDGYPRGAMLTHANHIYAATGYARHQGFQASDRLLIILPMCHVYALSGCVNAGLVRGAALVLSRHHMPRGIFSDIERHRVTILSSVPGMFECLSDYGKKDRYDLSSLRRLVTGGAYMPAGRQRVLEQALGAEMVQGYGLTECLPVICNPPGDGNRHGTLGVPGRRDITIRIMGAAARPLPPGEVGEIQIRSTTTMAGYYRLPQDTKAIFDGDWLRTGDLGSLDTEGYLHFCGMTKPIVNLNGNKVDPQEIREAILGHPAVAEVEVTVERSKHSDHTGEIRLCASITCKPQRTVTDSGIRKFCMERLAVFKIPHIRMLHNSANSESGD